MAQPTARRGKMAHAGFDSLNVSRSCSDPGAGRYQIVASPLVWPMFAVAADDDDPAEAMALSAKIPVSAATILKGVGGHHATDS